MTGIEALADAAGIQRAWHEASGALHQASPEVLCAVLAGLGLGCAGEGEVRDSFALLAEEARVAPLVTGDVWKPIDFAGEPGPARLTLEDGRSFDVTLEPIGAGRVRLRPILEAGYHCLAMADRLVTVAVAPDRCISVGELTAGSRAWAPAVQLYSLRDSPGSGDLGALAALAPAMAKAGADALAISPIHALFTADPGQPSPYSASSRRFLNPWYADPVLAGGPSASGAGDPPLIDWPAVLPERFATLRTCFEALDPAHQASITGFAAAGGPDLAAHARFEALQAHFHEASGAHGWRDWPAAYRQPGSPQVEAFARAHSVEIGFHRFLQWLTDRSLGAAQAAARGAGMRIGLIADVALGVDPSGSDAWRDPGAMMAGLTIGSPPDAFNAHGQEWGITGFSPRMLRRDGFAPYLAMLRSAMRHAGGVRLDHVLGVRRLFVIPSGGTAADGVYLGQPEADLLRLIALESRRHHALVIGEDLGTVPDGFRDTIAARGLLGMRVLQFERDWTGAFIPPAQWSRDAIALTSTHDLPPVAGWWQATDLAWRARLDRTFDQAGAAAHRAEHRGALWRMATQQGAARGDEPAAGDPAAVVDAALDMIAASPAPLVVLPLDDLLGLDEAPNLPGTVDAHPNWRRRLPLTSQAMVDDPVLTARLERLMQLRQDNQSVP